LYAIVFLALAGLTPHGTLAYALVTVLAIEAVLTMWDFVIEDQTRKLPWTERIAHTLLTLNYGLILAFWLPVIFKDWAMQPTGLAWNYYGLPTWFNLFVAGGVTVWAVRDIIAFKKIKRWQEEKPPVVGLKKDGLKFLVTGGTGFIGTELCSALIREGHDVTILTRNKPHAFEIFGKEKGKLTLVDSLDNFKDKKNTKFDVVINLAGEPLAKRRWTKKQKEIIHNSRVRLTKELVNFLSQLETKPSVLISGSAIGFYGAKVGSADEIITEDSLPVETSGFSQNLCQNWEQNALEAEKLGIRVVLIRTGIVLGRTGGVLSQLLFPFEFGLGGNIGKGKHYMPWIHIHDMLGIIGHSINNENTKGPINATAPNPVTNAEFTKTLAKVLKRPAFMHLPGFVFKILFGSEMANDILLTGLRIVPKKAEAENYKFKYEHLEDAIKQITT
jgi:uncharacterized protein (TIGR01777 family)